MKMPAFVTFRSGAFAIAAVVAAGLLLGNGSGATNTAKDTAKNLAQNTNAKTLLLVPADIAIVGSGQQSDGIRVTGSLSPVEQTTVHARINAVVESVLVREGEQVKKGQLLVQQDTADVQAQVRQAEAQMNSAKVEWQLTEAMEKRKKELHDKGYVSDLDFAAAQGDTQVKLGQLKVAEAQLAIARKSATDAQVFAPMAGIVSERRIEPGNSAMPGQVLLMLVNPSVMELAADVPARDIPAVRVGNAVEFGAEGYPGRTFHGAIARINPVANAGARTVRVYARVDNADAQLRGGLFVSGRILVAAKNSATALRIPASAVHTTDGKDSVWVVRRGALALQNVVLGAKDSGDGLVEVRQGLAKGETVIVTTIGKHTAGTAVTIAAPP